MGKHRANNWRVTVTNNLFTARPQDTTSDANVQEFLMHQFLMRASFINLVVVVGVSGDGNIVDVRQVVHGFTGTGDKIEKGIVFGVPVWRLQRGSSAVKMKPVVGDIGLAACCDRDITNVKKTKSPNLPGSNRSHSQADAIYLGGVLNQEPSQYIDFADGEIAIVSPVKVRINAPISLFEGDIAVTGKVTATGDVVGAGISLSTHVHGGVESGGSNTSGPE
ncbi:oxidoreductase [Serratia liquefaciens]|nr:oxidoreductase [Serratia liquefaciens]